MNLKRIAKGLINRAVRPWGMELAYTHVLERPELRRDWLKSLPVRTVLDIGANTGDFAAEIRDLLPEAFIYSFEPLRDAHAQLVSRMGGDGRFRAFNFAVGAEDSRAVIHRSAFSPSSSLLPMLDLHTEAWPHTAEAATEEIDVRRLDSVAVEEEPELLVKIDVQGFEDKVIEGGRATLARASYVVTEVSFARLYEGQPLFEDIYGLLAGMGFAYRGSLWQLPDPRDGRPLQADAVFVRNGAAAGGRP
ncbi:MAG: FkbM family methyltransferase [Acidobacteriota bacterium]|nr:FkbM family methyltransferase [Acidobacteriota bacterium]